MNVGKQLPRLFLNALVAMLAVLGTVFCVATAFDLYVNTLIVVLAAGLSAFLFTACFLWKKALWILLPLGAGMLLMGLFTDVFSAVGPSLRQLGHDILTRFSSAYPNISFAIPAEPAGSYQDFTVLAVFLSIILSAWMAWGVGYRSCLISVAGTLPFLLLCVIINDTPPHVAPLVMLLTAWVTVLLSRERPGEPASMDAMRMSLVLMSVLLLLTIIGTVYPKDDTSGQELPELVQNVLDRLPGPMQNMLSRDSDGISNDDMGADTSETLDLTTQGTRERTDTVMMQLSSTETGILYLRSAAKDVYTGSSWSSCGEATVSESIYAQTSLGQAFGDITQAAVQIRNYYDDTAVAFTPYGFISCTGASEITSDLRVSCLEDDYIVYFWPDLSTLDLSSAVGITNDDYDSYVEDVCLDLPEDTRETLYNLALSYGYDPDYDTLETISWVTEFVRTIGTYRLNVSRQPVNYDFAVYFLTESQAGYCVHFATATATMLRALGVPARYASGYRVNVTEAGSVVDVTDQDTHAWAEVYLSGLGWLPVESTPGFGTTLSLPEIEDPPELAEPVTPEVEEAPEDSAEPETAEEPSPEPEEEAATSESEEEADETEPSPEPEEPSESSGESDEAESAESSETPSDASEGGDSTASEAASAPPGWLWWLLGIPALLLLTVLILLIRHRTVLTRRKKRFQTEDLNQAVICRWTYVERLVPWGAIPTPEMEQLALRAKFSQHTITPEELQPYADAVVALSRSTEQALTRWRRFRFRWLSCLNLRA